MSLRRKRLALGRASGGDAICGKGRAASRSLHKNAECGGDPIPSAAATGPKAGPAG